MRERDDDVAGRVGHAGDQRRIRERRRGPRARGGVLGVARCPIEAVAAQGLGDLGPGLGVVDARKVAALEDVVQADTGAPAAGDAVRTTPSSSAKGNTTNVVNPPMTKAVRTLFMAKTNTELPVRSVPNTW